MGCASTKPQQGVVEQRIEKNPKNSPVVVTDIPSTDISVLPPLLTSLPTPLPENKSLLENKPLPENKPPPDFQSLPPVLPELEIQITNISTVKLESGSTKALSNMDVSTPQTFRIISNLPSRIPTSSAAKSLKKREEYRTAMYEVLMADAEEVILAANEGRKPNPIDVDSIVTTVRERQAQFQINSIPFSTPQSLPPTSSVPMKEAAASPPFQDKRITIKKKNTRRIPLR